jgi:hypothetical protein
LRLRFSFAQPCRCFTVKRCATPFCCKLLFLRNE